jgi:hypothetical protein
MNRLLSRIRPFACDGRRVTAARFSPVSVARAASLSPIFPPRAQRAPRSFRSPPLLWFRPAVAYESARFKTAILQLPVAFLGLFNKAS